MAKKAYIGAKLLTNLIPDGDFETTGWSGGARDSAHVKYGRYARKMTGSTSEFETTVSSTATIQLTPSHKYYVCVEAYQTAVSGSVDIYWPIAEPVMLSGQVLPKANQWHRISTVANRSSFGSGKYQIRFDYNNQNQAGTMWFDGAMLIDLTAAFGSGKEPTKEWCDAHIQFTAGGQVCCFDTANSAARQIKNIYIGVGGKARKVKKAYVGVGGKARLFYTSTLPPAIVDLWSTSSSDDTVKSITYANGYWVVGGCYHHADSNTTTAQIAYTTSVNSPWTTVSVWETTSNGNTINCIAYANGYWVVGGEYRYKTSSYKARIAYATSLDGPWTTVDLWDNYKSGFGVNDITYANGYWVVCGDYRGSSSRQATIAYATSPEGAWTEKTLWSGSSSYDATATGIAYANGYWVVGGTYENSSNTFGRIAYATSLDGTWTTKDVWSGNEIERLTYANGNWIVCGRLYSTSDSDARIAYAANPSGTWTQSIVWSGFQSTEAVGATYADGHWVVYGVQYENSTYYARIAYATSLNGPWTTKDLWNSDNSKNLICGMDYDGTYWMAGGEYADTTYYARIAYSAGLGEFDQI